MMKFTGIMIGCMLSITTAFSQMLVTSAEAESGVLTGVSIGSQTGSSSGSYVTGFDADGDKVTVTVTIPAAALYKLVIRYRCNQGDKKVQDIYVNNALISNLTFLGSSDFVDIDAGKIPFNAGSNTIAVVKNWGYMDVDKFSIYTAPANVYAITTSLIDTHATTEAKTLYAFLLSQFGKRTLSGQTSDQYDALKTATGKSPLLRAYDLLSYSPMYPYNWANGGFAFGAVDNHGAENAIAWYNSTDKKGIVSFHWHWYSPSGGTVGTNTFYTENTTFDISKAVVNGTPENTDALRDIDAIAVPLKKLSDANVPIVWRPLHEAGGGWFWWGAKGNAACKAMWDIVYDRLTNYHNLHNMVWIWSSPEADWYPGNDKVDMIGYDSYPGEFQYITQKGIFDQLYTLVEGQKMIAMSENGPIPDPTLCYAQDAPWLYFMSWGDLVFSQNSNAHLGAVYNSDYIVTLENITATPPTVVTALENIESPNVYSYPNPVVNTLALSDTILRLNPKKIMLFEINGAKLFECYGYTKTISVENLPSGVYVLKIVTADKVYTSTIMK